MNSSTNGKFQFLETYRILEMYIIFGKCTYYLEMYAIFGNVHNLTFWNVYTFLKCSQLFEMYTFFCKCIRFWKLHDFRKCAQYLKIYKSFENVPNFWKCTYFIGNVQNFLKCTRSLEMYTIFGNEHNWKCPLLLKMWTFFFLNVHNYTFIRKCAQFSEMYTIFVQFFIDFRGIRSSISRWIHSKKKVPILILFSDLKVRQKNKGLLSRE